MLITIKPAGRYARIPVELRNKPKKMPWYEYCSKLKDSGLMDPAVELTLHLTIGQFEAVLQEFEQTLRYTNASNAPLSKVTSATICGVHLICDVPEYN